MFREIPLEHSGHGTRLSVGGTLANGGREMEGVPEYWPGHDAQPYDPDPQSHDVLGADWDGAYPHHEQAGGSGYPAPGEIGNPDEYQQDWFFQEQNGFCVPSSLTEVIAAQSGVPLHSYTLVEQEAARLGLPATGLTLPQAQELLAGFDVPSHIVYGENSQTAIGELSGYLSQGRNVVLAVNASPIWYGSATADNPSGQADHALVVSAINPVTGAVTLSDPGTPDGNEEQVPMSTFLRAWSASDYGMLVTDDPVGGAGQSAAAAAVGHDLSAGGTSAAHTVAHAAEAGFVVLPIAFAGAWGYTALRDHLRKDRD
jgi:hypothetical protein